MLSISLPRIFEDQGSGYSLRVYKITLKWTGPVKILTKGQLGSNLVNIQGGSFNWSPPKFSKSRIPCKLVQMVPKGSSGT